MNVTQSTEKISTAENFARSAKAPMMRAGVIAAKVIWKAMKTYSGSTTPPVKVAAVVSGVTPARKTLPRPPQ